MTAPSEDTLDRPQFDAVTALIERTEAEVDADPGTDAHQLMLHGMRLALAEIARTRYVLEPAKFGAHWWDVADTWTGWGERGYMRGQTRDADLAAATAHAQMLNDQAAQDVLAGVTQ